MTTPAELEAAFWSHLKSDRIVMLSTKGAAPRPMAAQLDDSAHIWFFTGSDTDLFDSLGSGGESAAPAPSLLIFQAKGQELWASVMGQLSHHADPAKIDELWSPMAAAWFKDGRDDPKLRLLRFDPGQAEIWKDASTLIAGFKSLLGRDPGKDYADHKTELRMG
jgi:general stress protein 26